MTPEWLAEKRIELPEPDFVVWVREYARWHAYHPANAKGMPGRRCPGASTLGDAFPDSKRGLMYWVENMAMEGVVRLHLAGEEIPSDSFLLRQALERHGLRWEQIRDAAAEKGTNIHRRMVEALARGEEIPDLDELPEEQQGYGRAMFRWWRARNPEPTHAEQVILSLEHGFAGRFDVRCKIDAPMEFCHGTGIVDAKTGKGVYRSSHIQLRLYEMAAEECGIGPSDWLMLLQLCEDGTYIEHPCAATREDALLAIQSYEAAKGLDKRMKGAR